MVKVLQLSVEVGKCQLPELVTTQYEEYLLTVSLTQQLSASTSLKEPQAGVVDFGTKLFIRLDKINSQSAYECFISLTGVTQGRTKVQVAKGTVLSKTDGSLRIPLQMDGRLGGGAWVQLQFSCGMVEVKESKSIINHSNSFKSNNPQKQSSFPLNEDSGSRSASNFCSTTLLTHADSKDSLNSSKANLKVSKQPIPKIASKQDLQTSAATFKPQFKLLDDTAKCQQTTTLLSMQIKIDQLEQSLTQLSSKLSQVNNQLESTVKALELQQQKNVKLQLQREQLWQLLSLQELKNKIAHDYVNKMNKIYDQLAKGGQQTFQLIEEKDEIIMLNEQLEVELHQKANLIEQLRFQICELKDKIIAYEVKETHLMVTEPSSIKKMHNLPGKDLEKIKSQKKIGERKASTFNKKQEESKETNNTKDTVNKLKEKEPEKRKSRKETEVKLTPNRNTRDIKSLKNQVVPSPKIPKGKAIKGAKIEQKTTLETSKKSTTEPSMVEQTTNLMINSRSHETESTIRQQRS